MANANEDWEMFQLLFTEDSNEELFNTSWMLLQPQNDNEETEAFSVINEEISLFPLEEEQSQEVDLSDDLLSMALFLSLE